MTMRTLATMLLAVSLVAAGCDTAAQSPISSATLGTTATASPRAALTLPSLADVPFYRADPAAQGKHPGPGPSVQPVLAWRATVGDMHMVPVLVDGLLIVGTNDGRLVALDGHSGETRWTYRATAGIKPSLAAVDGLVYASDGSALHAVDVATGDRRWSAPVDDPVGRVNVVGGVAFAGTAACSTRTADRTASGLSETK
ncbi:MAG TPA: PQQ-binding-like beta-propeller repeat protein, partial [Candidatus Limnocylindrales bacterium]